MDKHKIDIKKVGKLIVILTAAFSGIMYLQIYQGYLTIPVMSFRKNNNGLEGNTLNSSLSLFIPTLTFSRRRTALKITNKSEPSIKVPLKNNESASNVTVTPVAPPKTFSKGFDKVLGPTAGIGEFRKKLVEYLKKKAKLTSQTTIDLLNKTIYEIESIDSLQLQSVPEEIIPLFKISYPNHFWKGKQLPLITSHISGRTGNIMGEYATLLALNRLYNVSVLIRPEMKKALEKDFPYLSLNETISDEDVRNSSLWHSIANEGGTFMYGNFELAATGLLGPKLFHFGGYGFEIQLWKFFYKDLKKDFTFSAALQKQADEYLHSVRNMTVISVQNIVYIGLHVRRTDYTNHMKVIFNESLPGDHYFDLALNYYRKKFNHPAFIAASDNTTFLQHSIIGKQKDVYISKGKSALVDMTILASCNHSIMTLGTFGFWGSYLAGGEVLYPVDITYKRPYHLNDRTLQQLKLPNFTPIKYGRKIKAKSRPTTRTTTKPWSSPAQ